MIRTKPYYVAGGACIDDTPENRKAATFIDRFENKYVMYLPWSQGRLLVPRGFVDPGGEDRRSFGSRFTVMSKFKPRSPDQEQVARQSVQLLENGKNHILQADTGWGKTIVGAEIAIRRGVTTLIVVPKSDLIGTLTSDQGWVPSLLKLGVPAERIGCIRANKCEVRDKWIVIGSVQSVCKQGRYPAWVYDYFGLMLFDECHVMGADKFSQTAFLFSAAERLGLSATPKRKDGRDRVFHSHVGKIMVTASVESLIPKVVLFPTGYKVPQTTRVVTNEDGTKRTVRVPIFHQYGRMAGVIKDIAANRGRNAWLVQAIQSSYQAGRNVVVFSDLLDHLSRLRKLAICAGIPSKDIGMYVGGTAEDRRAGESAKRIVFTTYKMCSMGTNVPRWDACVLATPRSDVRQPVGRIRREYPGKKQPVVFDPQDDGSHVLASFAKSRQRWYRSIGAYLCEGLSSA